MVGLMKTKLITALRQSAAAVRNQTFGYEWSNMKSCNCGVVACALLGYDQEKLNTSLPTKPQYNWLKFVGEYCPVTGLPEHLVLRAMTDAGLSPRDIIELEAMSNQQVLARMPVQYQTKIVGGWWAMLFGRTREVKQPRPFHYTNRQDLVLYLEAWADLLEEQADPLRQPARRDDPFMQAIGRN